MRVLALFFPTEKMDSKMPITILRAKKKIKVKAVSNLDSRQLR